MTIYFAADHAGYELKETLVPFVRDVLGYDAMDYGAEALNPNDDYPQIVRRAVEAVAENPEERKAIILGGSGQGEAIVANRFPHVRAAVYYGGNRDIITLSREHNNANVLSLGARFLDDETAKGAVALWLSTSFSGDERHVRRIKDIDGI
jgi:ribose 5-phosphate isomerase B